MENTENKPDLDFEKTQGTVEPLTGSLVFNETEDKVPDNGFPAGYGPNEGIKKIEKPKKVSFFERMRHVRKKMTKKQKVIAISVPTATVLVAVGLAIFAAVSGMFKVDYSGTYLATKNLKNEMQKFRSDVSCDKVIEYVNNQYTTMTIYRGYIDECQRIGDGISDSAILPIGETAGVLKDEEVGRRFETLKASFDAARDGNRELKDLLTIYSTWHEWVIAEASGNNSHQDWDWPESDLKKAAAILTDSSVAEFQKYGEEWLKLKKEAADATNTYFHHALNTADDLVALSNAMKQKQEAFTSWKKKKEPKVTELYPLELVDTAKLYAKFEDFYNFVRETYQKNYNKEVGGCKELVTAVVCE